MERHGKSQQQDGVTRKTKDTPTANSKGFAFNMLRGLGTTSTYLVERVEQENYVDDHEQGQSEPPSLVLEVDCYCNTVSPILLQ